MAIQDINTDVAPIKDRGDGGQAHAVLNQSFQANTSSRKEYQLSPKDGKVLEIQVSGAVTSDATKTYTFVVKNLSTAKTVTAASQVFDADPVLTANVVADLTLSTTAADLVVNKGDLIEIDFTGGTGSGAAAVKVVLDN